MNRRLLATAALAVLAATGLLGAKKRPRSPQPADPPAAEAAAPAPAQEVAPAPAPGAAPVPAPRREPFLPTGLAPAASGVDGHGGETKCSLCHNPRGWTPASFAHDQTGFPLKGSHQGTPCKGCHLTKFTDPLPRNCAGCHRDAHKGDFGQRCEGCHDVQSWKTAFTAEAHQRTNFPLLGRHATIPCQECHFETRDRQFTRTAVDCYGCHAKDYDRTATTSLNHAALGFATTCRDCHTPWRFQGASFPGHNKCFLITAGKHANIRCLSCHTTLVGVTGSLGTCSTGTASCTGCHTHSCAETDRVHQDKNVPGYQCKDRKCYECHRFSTQ